MGLAIFFVSLISMLLIKTEFLLAIKNDYKRKPPFQALIIFISSYLLLFWILPESFMGQSKTTPIILMLLIIPNIALTIILHALYSFIFIKLLKIITKFGTREILTESDLLEKIKYKTNEIKRYGGTFSLIMITFMVPKFAVNKLQQTMAFSLFYELIRKYIRNTDYLGICKNGSIATVLSNNNNYKKAETQAQRILNTLKKNSILMKKIEVYNAEFASALCENNPELTKENYLYEETIKKIKEDQVQYWNKFSKKE